MKCLSIKQPWSWLICAGYKDVENRGWPTKVRGRVYVHAGQSTSEMTKETIAYILRRLNNRQAAEFMNAYNLSRFALGAIIGEVGIVDCKFRFGEENDTLYSVWHVPGQYGFVLANPVLYAKPILYKARLGFFDVTLPPEAPHE